MVYGLYVIMHGHLTPGGGFQGGAVVASGCALLLVAYSSEWIVKKIKESNFSILESIGAIGFVGLAFLGIGTTFFYNFLAGRGLLFGNIPVIGPNSGDLNTAGTLPLMNLAVGLKVIAGLFAIVVVMAFATAVRRKKQ
jgi:multicomponent Na+:H+ antiporter subunit B